jgi:hypothetical protein
MQIKLRLTAHFELRSGLEQEVWKSFTPHLDMKAGELLGRADVRSQGPGREKTLENRRKIKMAEE